ncbi:MAG: hypothetical protein AAFX06_33790 [Planctomycetota bacterium]
MAKTFRDNLNDEWVISLTLSKARSLRDQLGTDVLNPEQYASLLGSPLDRLAFVFVLCSDQAKERGLDVDTFEERLYGDGFADAASVALLEETEDFFRRLGQNSLAILAEKSVASMKAGQERMAKAIQSGAYERVLDAAQAEMDKMIPAELRGTDGNGSPDSGQSAG